jgi:hypothetical protein
MYTTSIPKVSIFAEAGMNGVNIEYVLSICLMEEPTFHLALGFYLVVFSDGRIK